MGTRMTGVHQTLGEKVYLGDCKHGDQTKRLLTPTAKTAEKDNTADALDRRRERERERISARRKKIETEL